MSGASIASQIACSLEFYTENVDPKHAICISNGTVSLEIALLAMGVGKSDEVRARAWAVGLWG